MRRTARVRRSSMGTQQPHAPTSGQAAQGPYDTLPRDPDASTLPRLEAGLPFLRGIHLDGHAGAFWHASRGHGRLPSPFCPESVSSPPKRNRGGLCRRAPAQAAGVRIAKKACGMRACQGAWVEYRSAAGSGKLAGILERILWVEADSFGATVVLRALGFGTAAAAARPALAGSAWPTVAILALTMGATAVAWTGILLARIARVGPGVGAAAAAMGFALVSSCRSRPACSPPRSERWGVMRRAPTLVPPRPCCRWRHCTGAGLSAPACRLCGIALAGGRSRWTP